MCTSGTNCLNLTLFPPKSTKSNYEAYKGEYIFLLDRSGSMGGSRIEKAKESLILFLKSLPEHSTYNIISFGSKFERMFKSSIAYNDSNVEETIKKIEMFDADFGGTEIAAPLLDIVKVEKQMSKYVRNVILITDGQVFNPEEVIKIISNMKENNVATVHAVGIGNGVSFDMIRRGAIQGGGEHIFIMDNKEMKRQIIQLL